MSIANITVDACDNAQKDRHEETANQTRFVLIEDRMRWFFEVIWHVQLQAKTRITPKTEGTNLQEVIKATGE